MRIFSKIILFVTFLACATLSQAQEKNPKREFRGAWLQTEFQEQFMTMNRVNMQEYLCFTLEQLKEAGFNAVIFQVRPSADAFYISGNEPLSKFFTGQQGKLPNQLWDPMDFLIEECHRRNMEFHAWITPYRVTTSTEDRLVPKHIYNRHPEWFVEYNGLIYFDPGLPQSRTHLRTIVKDIVTRYDVDGIQLESTFYPEPVEGQEFNDKASFEAWGPKLGFDEEQKSEWRRQNTSTIVRNIHDDIREIKPWVHIGMSCEAIYKHQNNDTSLVAKGISNYEDIYADVQDWGAKGWIDYISPKIYNRVGDENADYSALVNWWGKNSKCIHTYIGQNIKNSLDGEEKLTDSDKQLAEKIKLSRTSGRHLQGVCIYDGYQFVDNDYKVKNVFRDKYFNTIAIIPSYTEVDVSRPIRAKNLKVKKTDVGIELTWEADETVNELKKQSYYCIYRFPKTGDIDTEDSKYLEATVRANNYFLNPETDRTVQYRYVVTSVNRMNNESPDCAPIKVKL